MNWFFNAIGTFFSSIPALIMGFLGLLGMLFT